MLEDIIRYLKNPTYEKDPNKDFKYRLLKLFKYVGLAIMCSLCLIIIPALLEAIFDFELGKHAMDDLFEDYSAMVVMLLVIILAPLLEELFFRGPIVWFKGSKYFRFVFYLIAILFGYIHITNFEISPLVLAISPLLVAPQISMGLLLGMIRVKFNLAWSIGFHALYNFILIMPMIIMKLLDIPIE